MIHYYVITIKEMKIKLLLYTFFVLFGYNEQHCCINVNVEYGKGDGMVIESLMMLGEHWTFVSFIPELCFVLICYKI